MCAYDLDVIGRHETTEARPDPLCTVHEGRRDYSVVCGAPNVKVDQRVAFALEGATLSATGRISKETFQGVLSEGMLCSEIELGLGQDASGIMILSSETPLGVELGEALGLMDTIIDISITPNRPDCLSMLGIAWEVAALTGRAVNPPSLDIRSWGLR
jgi:phenylalanyl-tRNA synthetase beta chain